MVVAFRATDPQALSVFDVSDRLRAHGWIVPAYRMPTGLQDMAVLRIVVRNGFSRDLAELLMDDLRAVTGRLAGERPARSDQERTGFHH